VAGAPHLSVVVPFYNERDNVEPFHAEVAGVLAAHPGGVEFIYVDDGSVDGTAESLAKVAAADVRVRVLRLRANAGQSAALETGFRACRGELVATMDADLQNDPADLIALLAAVDRADVVNGVRIDRRDTWVRKLSSRVANGFRNWMTHESVTDVGCSLRVMRRQFLDGVTLYRGMHRFLPTLLRMRGARVIELPVRHRARRHGESKYGIGNRLFTGLADVFAVRWMQRRTVRCDVDASADPHADGAGDQPDAKPEPPA